MKLIITFSLVTCFSFSNLFSQGFGTSPTNWPIPQGGHTYSTIDYGYDALSDFSGSGDTIGNQTWSVTDLNGDGKPDLVITAEAKAVTGFSNQATVFGSPGSSYWKVYLNNGSGFSSTSTNWSIPQGGHTYSTINYGYDALGYTSSGGEIGNQTWSVTDLNGDNKPDLVITAETKAITGFSNQATVFGLPGSAYWKVYLNNGSGFNNTSINWPIPQGGHTYSTINYGYDALGYTSSGGEIGNQTWSVTDLNGDNKPDLVITAETKAITGFSNQATVFGSPGSAYWKIYLNNGSGFNNTSINWPIPQGGHTYSTINYGYDALGYTSSGGEIGNQTWSVTDLNGDNKPDLVITAETKAITGFSNQATVFGSPGNAYWKVYLNNGSGFNNTSGNWIIPQGGHTYSTINYGYDALNFTSSGGEIGNQTWSVTDLNGDNKPDLVITAETKVITGFSNQATVFGSPSNAYWKVYLNNGSGFNITSGNWIIPQGGHSYSTINYGYDALAYSSGSGSDIGNHTWSVTDLNGDNKPDLVITAESKAITGFANQATAFGPTNGRYWKVFFNTGILQTENFMSNQEGISVFPNPSNGQFHVETLSESENLNFEVIDLAGRVILKNTGSKTIDLFSFPKGIYILNMHIGHESYVKKLILK